MSSLTSAWYWQRHKCVTPFPPCITSLNRWFLLSASMSGHTCSGSRPLKDVLFFLASPFIPGPHYLPWTAAIVSQLPSLPSDLCSPPSYTLSYFNKWPSLDGVPAESAFYSIHSLVRTRFQDISKITLLVIGLLNIFTCMAFTSPIF